MLTTTVTAVKIDHPLTPEQVACSMKTEGGLKTFWNVVEHRQHAADRQQPIHQVEETIFRNHFVSGEMWRPSRNRAGRPNDVPHQLLKVAHRSVEAVAGGATDESHHANTYFLERIALKKTRPYNRIECKQDPRSPSRTSSWPSLATSCIPH
jgi:hypothetical protein